MANNHPDRFGRFVLPMGMRKVEASRDTRIQNACTFTVYLEDHTLGNLIRTNLLRNSHVLFAGYRIPHPLEIPLRLQIKVQTDGKETPHMAMCGALKSIGEEVSTIRAKFMEAAQQHQATAY